METSIKVSPYPIPELAEFLRPYRKHFYRVESLQVLERYATGLLAEIGQRKSGAAVAEAVAGLSRSALYRLLTETVWDETAVNRQRIGTMVARAVAGDGMLVIDDTGFPHKGKKAVGIAHQYCGELGKKANCQVVVTIHYVDPYYAWPVLGWLYLPESWCEDEKRRKAAEIPGVIVFQTKPEIALDLIDQARAAGIPFTTVGADSGYGDNPNFLDGLDSRQLGYVVAVACDFGVRLLDEVAEAAARPLPVKEKEGRPRIHPHPDQVAPLYRADVVIADQPDSAWQTITWRMGDEGPLTKQFIAVRVCRSHGDITGPEGWLIGERPLPDHDGEHKYYWSNMSVSTPLARLAELAHRRPGVERGYQDGKGFTGLGDYPARLWHSFHRSLAIEMLVLSWLVLQQPPPAKVEIVLEPPSAVETPDEPVFPLRPGTLPQRGGGSGASLPVPVHRVGMLARPERSDRRVSACRSASLT
jgi:SRSO17 transposase